jgi:hypothetical protein
LQDAEEQDWSICSTSGALTLVQQHREFYCGADRKLLEAEEKYGALLEERRAVESDYKEVLAQYDVEFEDKGDQMADRVMQVYCGRL